MIDGLQFIESLKAILSAKSDSDLAKRLGYNPASISQLKQGNLTKLVFERYLKKLIVHNKGAVLKEAVHPIVELFPVERLPSSQGKTFSVVSQKVHGELVTALDESFGIYAFYNSEGSIIYLGKAEKQSLWKEMNLSYNRSRPSYKMLGVNHPHGRWKPNDRDTYRKITKKTISLVDTVSYFSAYQISDDLISALEALMIRLAPNDLINVKIETGIKKTEL